MKSVLSELQRRRGFLFDDEKSLIDGDLVTSLELQGTSGGSPFERLLSSDRAVPLPHDEQALLFKDRLDNESKRRLIESNVRLCVSVAKRYHMGGDLKLFSLFGVTGLLRALEKYDLQLGYKLSTYAVNWVRQVISRAKVEWVYVWHIPVHQIEKTRSLFKERQALWNELGRPPSLAELSERTGESVERVSMYMGNRLQPLSLEYRTSFGECLIDRVWDASWDLAYEVNQCNSGKCCVKELLLQFESVFLSGIGGALDKWRRRKRKRLWAVLKRRIGFGCSSEETLNAIGDDEGLSRERIRQMEDQAFKVSRKFIKTEALLSSIDCFVRNGSDE